MQISVVLLHSTAHEGYSASITAVCLPTAYAVALQSSLLPCTSPWSSLCLEQEEKVCALSHYLKRNVRALLSQQSR